MIFLAKKLAFAVFCGLFLAGSGFGWDDVGHKITGYIAWQRMTPHTRENVIRILRAAPEDSQLSAFYKNYGPETDDVKRREFFMLVPTWADIVRDRAFETRYRKYHHSNWHYDDIFWKQVDGRVEHLTGFEEGGVAIPRLVEFDAVMRDPAASNADKAVAIAWILHLTGDLHQPLHTSARVTDSEPKGDQGANLVLLTPEGTPRDKQVNLHWFWDSIVGRNITFEDGMCEREYIEMAAKKMIKAHPFQSMQAKLNLQKFEDWRNESFAYNNTIVFSPDLKRFQMPPEKYKKSAFKLAEERLALAGYRLGETLNSVFDSPPPAAAQPAAR